MKTPSKNPFWKGDQACRVIPVRRAWSRMPLSRSTDCGWPPMLAARPEVMIGAAQTKFDEAGRLTDEATADFIRP